MNGFRKIIGDIFGVGAVIALVVVQLAALPAAIYGFSIWSDWGVGASIALLLVGSAFIPFFEIPVFGFAVYGAYLYFGG